MKKWEYTSFGFTELDGQALMAKMNELGNDGWEYCGQSVHTLTMTPSHPPTEPTPAPVSFMLYQFMFKREKALVQKVDRMVSLG